MARTAKNPEVSFDCSLSDKDLISDIAVRADNLGLISLRQYPMMTCVMDVTAVHCNGNPLRLRDLLDATDFNFMHDIVGIARHLNRETGQLEDFFSPRFSKREAA